MVASDILAVKRPMSDSDSELIDDLCTPSNESVYLPKSREETQGFSMARKKRRGLIEKRRRDRINRSLNELKSIIPMASERQAAAKLEKSEVLSLAVEHIKALQMKDGSCPHTMAIDYRMIGYRECINEMITYLTHSEGLGPSEPLHNRLVSHLYQQAMTLEQSHGLYYTGSPSQLQPIYSPPPSNYHTSIPAFCKPEPVSPVPGPALAPSYISHRDITAQESYQRFTEFNSTNSSCDQFTGTICAPPINSKSIQQVPVQCNFMTQSAWV